MPRTVGTVLDFGARRGATNLSDPTSPQDAATKNYVDAALPKLPYALYQPSAAQSFGPGGSSPSPITFGSTVLSTPTVTIGSDSQTFTLGRLGIWLATLDVITDGATTAAGRFQIYFLIGSGIAGTTTSNSTYNGSSNSGSVSNALSVPLLVTSLSSATVKGGFLSYAASGNTSVVTSSSIRFSYMGLVA